MADYIFYRTFDVGKYIISEKFPSLIGGIEGSSMYFSVLSFICNFLSGH